MSWVGYVDDRRKRDERREQDRRWYARSDAEHWYAARNEIATMLAASPLDLKVSQVTPLHELLKEDDRG